MNVRQELVLCCSIRRYLKSMNTLSSCSVWCGSKVLILLLLLLSAAGIRNDWSSCAHLLRSSKVSKGWSCNYKWNNVVNTHSYRSFCRPFEKGAVILNMIKLKYFFLFSRFHWNREECLIHFVFMYCMSCITWSFVRDWWYLSRHP